MKKTLLFYIVFALVLIGTFFLFGCDSGQVKKMYVKSDFKSDEAFLYYICTQQSEKSQDGLIKELQQQAKDLSIQNEELIEGKNTLIVQNKELSELLISTVESVKQATSLWVNNFLNHF